MTRDKLNKYLKMLTFRARVTECYMFLLVEISNGKNITAVDDVVHEIKQLGVVHKVVKLKWWKCWFPRYQWIKLG